jgi:glucose/arabinose dehydrogenase
MGDRQLSFRLACAGAALAAALGTPHAVLSQPSDIGIQPPALEGGPFHFDTGEQHRIRVDVVARGLPHPFALDFLPNGDALIAVRGEGLRFMISATDTFGRAELETGYVPGGPAPADFRGGGIHDVAIPPDFADTRLVYYTYNKPGAPDPNADPPGRRPTAVTLARARFTGGRLVEAQDLFEGEMRPGASGSRIAFGSDDTLFITTGAPFDDAAQSPDNVYGKVLRLTRDGGIPSDNPFVGVAGARGEVYTLGHRDQLGLTVHPETGAVLSAEHGPNGGDEVNLILPGRNYGWPDFSFGRSYEGPRHSEAPLGPNIEQPIVVWLPSIAPTGMTFYTGTRFPAWTNNLFVGSARRGQIPGTGGLERVVFNENLEELRRETLLTELHQRIRDVAQGPDGMLYVVTDEDDGALLRISPSRP